MKARLFSHRGFTLLEVLLAIAILGTALLYLGDGFSNSLRNIEQARQEIRGNLVAESVMSQVAAGVLPPESVGSSTYEFDSRFMYSIEVEPVPGVDGLLAVKVSVTHSDVTPPKVVTLSRWITDPIWLEEQAANNPLLNGSLSTETMSSSSTTGSGSSSTMGSTGGGS